MPPTRSRCAAFRKGVEVRDGRVEESERSEGDDVGLRVLVGQRQAVVSTNDVSGDGIARLAERAVAMARVAPDDKYVGLADPSLLARDFPDLDLLDPEVPSTAELERRACEAEAAGLAVKGVTKSGGASASTGIGGMVLVTSTGFHGSYLRSSQGISMTAISGDGTGMERDYDYTTAPHASDLASPESVGRTAGERTVARANPRKVETCKVPVVFDPRVSGSIVGHLVGAVNGASIARKTSFLKDRLGEQLFAKNIRIIDDPLRVRGLRSQTFDAEGVKVKKLAIIDEGVLTSWLLDSATARELGLVTTGHAQRGVSSSPSPGSYNLHLEAGEPTPAELISRHQAGILRHRPDRLRRQRRDRRLQPRRLRVLDRERRDHLCGERGDDRGPSARDLQIAGAGQRSGIPLRRQCSDAADRGIDAWRTLAPAACTTRFRRDMLARDAALLTDTVREAGALALSLFRTELKNWTKGASSPVSEADIAVNDLLEKRLRSRHAGLWLAVGRKRRRRAAARQAPGLDRRSDRRHPRLSRRPRRLVRQRGAGRGRLAGAGGGVRAGQRRIFLCRARAGRHAQRCRRFMRRRAPSWIFPASPVRNRWSSGSAASSGRDRRFIRESDRWRCGCAGSREGQARCRVCRRPKPRLGPCRGQFDRAGSEW